MRDQSSIFHVHAIFEALTGRNTPSMPEDQWECAVKHNFIILFQKTVLEPIEIQVDF